MERGAARTPEEFDVRFHLHAFTDPGEHGSSQPGASSCSMAHRTHPDTVRRVHTFRVPGQ